MKLRTLFSSNPIVGSGSLSFSLSNILWKIVDPLSFHPFDFLDTLFVQLFQYKMMPALFCTWSY